MFSFRQEWIWDLSETSTLVSCELCEAARLTEWFYEDDMCWIAECEACSVPMVVWKDHSPSPPDDVRLILHQRLLEIAGLVFDYEPYVDDNMRNIPDHYHAHARWKGRWFSESPPRRPVSSTDFLHPHTPVELSSGQSDDLLS